MKIFNYENNNTVVYVRYDALARLLSNDIPMPTDVYNSVSGCSELLSNKHYNKFMKFTSEEAVNFLKKLDWIADFKIFRKFSEKQLLEAIERIKLSINEIEERFESLAVNDMVRNQHLVLVVDRLNIKLNSVKDILLFKQGKKDLQLPIVADSDGLLVFSSNLMYKMQSTLNPQQMVITKTNGNTFRDYELIPRSFYKDSLRMLIQDNQESNELFNNFEVSDSISDDKTSRITTLSIVVPDEEVIYSQKHCDISTKKLH